MSKKIKIDPETITLNEFKAVLSKLQLTFDGAEPRDNQKIEGKNRNRENACFQITKETSRRHPEIVFYVFRVWGPSESGRQSFIGDFIRLLGNPISEYTASPLLNVDFLYWESREIDGNK